MMLFFNSFFYYPNLFAVNDGGGYLPHHRYQSGNNFASFASFAALPPTTNLRIGTWTRGGTPTTVFTAELVMDVVD
ncbi:hypothetical protein HanIR_Chr11g0544861 [Helianthus annuus]|nr:hypothetical protein HanIR_Chr11g0544861 [Helianthus annuus]